MVSRPDLTMSRQLFRRSVDPDGLIASGTYKNRVHGAGNRNAPTLTAAGVVGEAGTN